MAITMLEASEVISNRFADSHLYDKLRGLLVVSRIFENVQGHALDPARRREV
jgi:hypothetical protein